MSQYYRPWDKWQFACPDCGSVSVRKLHDPATRRKESLGTKHRPNRMDMAMKHAYFCRQCKERKKRLLDKKHGDPTRP